MFAYSIATDIYATCYPSGFKFISAVDNDKAGRRYTEKFQNAFSENLIVDIPFLKDFNEDLKRSRGKIRSLKI